MLTLTNVSKDFSQGSDTIHALKTTNFEAIPGEFVAIIGPSGSGKSTFLTILGGLQTPTTGEVSIAGHNISQASEKERARVRFNNVGFILQASSLVPFLKVNEKLLLHDKVAKTSPDLERRDMLLETLGVSHLAKKYPSELSGGERQRVAIATALMHDPDIILADEPTAALDTDRAFETTKLLRDLTHELNKTTIMVTHDRRLLSYCDRIYRIVDGVLNEEDVADYR